MAWTQPVTWTTSSGPSAAQLNAQLRDNLLSLRNNNDWLVHCSKSAGQSITTAQTAITFNVHDYIVGTTAIHSTASGSKFMAPVAGYYRLIGTAVWNQTSGYRQLSCRLNGATDSPDTLNVMWEGAAGFPREQFGSINQPMTTADYLEIFGKVYNNTSGTIISGATGTRFGWYLLGAST